MTESQHPFAPIPGPAGVVLSGGGARGAYSVGVMCGLTEVLRGAGHERAPFEVFSGTSVGAILAAWMAAHADEPDMRCQGLAQIWRDLSIREHLRIDPVSMLTQGRARRWAEKLTGRTRRTLGTSMLDPRALEELVQTALPYERLHRNVRSGKVRSLIVSALEIATGRTTVFAELAPGAHFEASRDPRRVGRREPITADHVLGSAAIPLLFPARRVGQRFYCDGGLRFNTPIAPALRTGASRLVVVSLLHEGIGGRVEVGTPPEDVEAAYPNTLFLLGKLLNALLLDAVSYDLQVLDRLNELMSVLNETLTDTELARVQEVLAKTRGVPYRHIETLVFKPSRDLSSLAHEHAQHLSLRNVSSGVLRALAFLGDEAEADLLSFVLFDGDFAESLIALGRKDALDRSSEILRFFADEHRGDQAA